GPRPATSEAHADTRENRHRAPANRTPPRTGTGPRPAHIRGARGHPREPPPSPGRPNTAPDGDRTAPRPHPRRTRTPAGTAREPCGPPSCPVPRPRRPWPSEPPALTAEDAQERLRTPSARPGA